MSYTHISLDTGVSDTGTNSLHESVPSDFNLEMLVEDRVLIEQLRQALRAWKPWAEELLEPYMVGAKRSCTNGLCKKYQLSDRTVQRRKEAFEKFVLDGRYQNVFLSDAELAELQTDFPTVWQEYIERLSEYMASTGKTYKSYAATIRRWIADDRRKVAPATRDRNYSVKEGDTV